jgi:hypothetical protein
MSLWTPDDDEPTEAEYDYSDGELDPETAARLEAELARSQAQLLAAPVAQVVSNHVMGLFELAALHLRVGNLSEARLPIDAMGVLVDKLGGRLAEAETLTAALTQLRMAYVELVNDAEGAQPDHDTDDDDDE